MWQPDAPLGVEVSFCVVNTTSVSCWSTASTRSRPSASALPFETEVLVLDNASTDGSAGAARRHPTVTEVVALDQRRGKGENDSHLLQRSRGRFCLLLNEDSELRPGATRGAARRADRPPSARRRRGQAAAPRRARAAVGVAVPDAGDRAASARCSCTSGYGAVARAQARAASTGRSRRRCWSGATPPATSAGSTRSSSSTPTRSTSAAGSPTPATTRSGSRPRGDPPRAALHRRRARAPDRRAVAQPRPLHAQAPLAAAPRSRAPADRLDLRAPRGRRHRRAPGTIRSATGAT